MRKLRFLVMAVLTAMASLSVGFAKIEKVPISGTVSTGALQVDLVGTTIDHDGYVTAQKRISTDSRQVVFTTDRMYPGAEVAMHVKAVNTGSRSVAFDSAVLTWEGDRGLTPYLEMLCGFQFDGNGDDVVDGGKPFASSWAALDSSVAAMNDSSVLRGMVLKPTGAFYLGTPVDGAGGALDYPLKIRLSPDATNETQNRSVTFTLQLNWREAALNCWTGDIEVQWYRVEREKGTGWDVFGDVYLICQGGSRELYEEKAVQGHFSGPEAPDYKTGSFWVEVGAVKNHYQVNVPKAPPADKEIVHPHD